MTIGPFEFDAVAIIHYRSARKLESKLHKMYRSKRIRGEWFELSLMDLLNIRMLEGSILPAPASRSESEVIETPVRGEDIQRIINISLLEAYEGIEKRVQSVGQIVTVNIQPGVRNGESIHVAGAGYAGQHGGLAGDLIVSVLVRDDPQFRRVGSDLYSTVPVAHDLAVNGGKISVPTLTGATEVDIAPGALSGKQRRIVGHGMPVRDAPGEFGDLLVTLRVKPRPVDGADIQRSVSITLREAYSGVRKRMPAAIGDANVRIPPGVVNGETLRVSGKGRPGKYGGKAGHVYLQVTVADDVRFTRKGDQLHTILEVHESIFGRGGAIVVPTLADSVQWQVSTGIRVGTVIRLPGHGMPRRDKSGDYGDMFVTLKIKKRPVDGKDAFNSVAISLRESYKGVNKSVRVLGNDVKVWIPPGIANRQTLRVKGSGHQGVHGGKAGDLHLQVFVKEDRRFDRDGADLITTAEVDARTAASGGELSVSTLTGKTQLQIPRGAKSGDKLRRLGQGMPVYRSPNQFGDLIVKLRVSRRPLSASLGFDRQRPASESVRRVRNSGYARPTASAITVSAPRERESATTRHRVLVGLGVFFLVLLVAGSVEDAPSHSVTRARSAANSRTTVSRVNQVSATPAKAVSATTATRYVSTIDNMPAIVRGCPRRSADCPVIGGLMPGEAIRSSKRVSGESIGGNASWLQFRYEGKTAYIHSVLVLDKKGQAAQYIVRTSNGGSARIRSCPQSSDDCAVIGGLANGAAIRPQQVVAGQGIAGNFLWFKFRHKSRNAYIHSSLVAPRP